MIVVLHRVIRTVIGEVGQVQHRLQQEAERVIGVRRRRRYQSHVHDGRDRDRVCVRVSEAYPRERGRSTCVRQQLGADWHNLRGITPRWVGGCVTVRMSGLAARSININLLSSATATAEHACALGHNY